MLPHEAKLQAGSATEEIVPDGPVEMSGYGNRDGPSTGVHDPLLATALVLDDGAVTVGVVSADLLNVSRELTRRVRRDLAEEGIRLDELFLAATHTHAGPYVPARALDVSPALGADADVSDVVERIEEKLVRAVARAFERREPASIRVGRSREEDVPHNRRAAGGVSGNVRLPSGTVDPEVTAFLIETTGGEQTVVYNFACHPVCTTGAETLLSADWPGYARRRIERDRDASVVFLNGAAGDINPCGMDSERTDEAVYEYMECVGTAVGEAVLRALEDAESSDARELRCAPIQVDGAAVRLPVKATPPAETIRECIASLNARLDRLADGDEVGFEKLDLERRYARTQLAIAEWDAECLPNRIPYLEIGEIGILGMPGEVLVRHGLDLKEQARAPTLIPAGYVNDYVGYVPTLPDLETTGYEVRTMKISPDAVVEFRRAARELVGADELP